MLEKRECAMMIVTGRKRIGKSNESLRMLLEDYIVTTPYKKGRKALIIDVNNEYGQYKVYSNRTPEGRIYPIKRIRIQDVAKFSMQTKIEVARVVPVINDDGSTPDEEELRKNFVSIIDSFRGGCLVVEDLNKVFGDALPTAISGTLVNNAHRDSDLIFHVQSVGRLLPKILQNTNIIRFHMQLDGVDNSAEKLKSDYEICKIAENLVQKQYNSKNIRFFVYINRDEQKIFGKFSDRMIYDAIKDYVSRTRATTRQYEQRRNADGKKTYTYDQCVELATRELFNKYNGNRTRQQH